ncbi:hypothetical protein GCM10026982_25540 [Nocardiopsis aegyptia]
MIVNSCGQGKTEKNTSAPRTHPLAMATGRLRPVRTGSPPGLCSTKRCPSALSEPPGGPSGLCSGEWSSPPEPLEDVVTG